MNHMDWWGYALTGAGMGLIAWLYERIGRWFREGPSRKDETGAPPQA